VSLFATDPNPDREEEADAAEFWETPVWASESILRREILSGVVIDPCCGSGVLSEAAKRAGYTVQSSDLNDWGYAEGEVGVNFLESEGPDVGGDFSYFFNSPFSLAVLFIRKALENGARKVVSFQRLEWFETKVRRPVFEDLPPNRIYVCGDRANCWLGSVPLHKRKGGQKRAHAWYIWERGHPPGTLIGHIWKDDVRCL